MAPRQAENHRPEPPTLHRGKAFHRRIQAQWDEEAEGCVELERHITKAEGHSGRIDIFVDAGDHLVAVVEIKSTDWDQPSTAAVRRYVRKYAGQVWDYIESQQDRDSEVSTGIILRDRPANSERVDLIEELFDEEGIPVAWDDESLEEAARRHSGASPD